MRSFLLWGLGFYSTCFVSKFTKIAVKCKQTAEKSSLLDFWDRSLQVYSLISILILIICDFQLLPKSDSLFIQLVLKSRGDLIQVCLFDFLPFSSLPGYFSIFNKYNVRQLVNEITGTFRTNLCLVSKFVLLFKTSKYRIHYSNCKKFRKF